MKVLTFFVVVILVLLLLQLVGNYIAMALPQAGQIISNIFQGAWDGIQSIIHGGYNNGHAHG
ncbi:MAG TPA: hypothetical protein VIY28_18275 [Pseudonocardiaceae bacterium]